HHQECVYEYKKARPVKLSLADARPDIAELWDYTLNTGKTPETISYGLGEPVNWKCPETSCSQQCPHSWMATVNSMTSRTTDSNGCPWCGHKKVCEHESLAALRPEIAAMLHPTLNPGVDPLTISVKSNKLFFFRCDNRRNDCTCDEEHVWEA
ncbi:hypothetical protein JKP88DRAFT_155798, partial [Tribonema minus]